MTNKQFKLFLVGLLVALLIIACKTNPTINSPSVADCRKVTHLLGEVCVPQIPQRLVSLDDVTLADALALDVPSVGVSLFGQLANYLADKLPAIELLGSSEQPNLEKIFQINPDLIMGLEFYGEPIFQQLSQIAPTAVGEWNGYPSWREYFNFVARILDKEAEAEVIWQNYGQRIEEIKAALGDRLKDVKVSVAYVCCGGISVDTANSFSGSILADIGIDRPASQGAVDGGVIILSEERILDLDGDIMFLIVYDDEQSPKILANWQQKPLWNQLKVVQNKQVYLVNHGIWRGGNPIAANLLIDDLYRYLVQPS